MMTTFESGARRRRQAGATLIEVLVSILLMALGVLAMAAMQVNAVQYGKTSEFRTLATLLANDLGDRMRANHPTDKLMSGSTGYDYLPDSKYATPTLPSMPRTNCADGSTTCEFDDMAAFDKAQWARTVFQMLPKGTARVKIAGTPSASYADIWIVWTDPSNAAAISADNCPTGYDQDSNVRCIYFRIAI